MKKRMILFVLLLIILILCLYQGRDKYRTWTGEETSEAFTNPRTGWYCQYDIHDTDAMRREAEKNNALKIVLLTMDLKKEADKEQLSAEILDALEQALLAAEEAEVSVIFRAAYDWKGEYEDPPRTHILSHAVEICGVLNRHAQQIMGVQAGFLGPWGEWHATDYVEYDTKEKPFQIEFLEHLLENLDARIPVGVRKPQFIRQALKYDLKTDRLGIYNDGLFGSDTDLGTYKDGEKDRRESLEFLEKTVSTSFNGGEMPYVSEVSDVNNAAKELSMMHASYLNGYADQAVISQWKEQTFEDMSGYDYITSHLGYRIWVEKVRFPQKLKKGKEVTVEGTVKNSGFSYIPSDMEAFLKIQSEDSQQILPLSFSTDSEDKGEFYVDFVPDGRFGENEKTEELDIYIMFGLPGTEKIEPVRLANEGYFTEGGWFLIGDDR